MFNFNNIWLYGIFGIIAQNTGAAAWKIVGVVLSLIAAYLLGSLNFGVIISRLAYRDDVRKHGSGNGGMTNMLRTYGKAPAVLTLVCDAAKAVLSILLFGRLFGGALGATFAGLGCIVGHAFPLYFGFRGGKGVVTVAVMIMCQNWIVGLTLMAVFFTVVLTTKYVSLGSCICMVIYPYVLYKFTGAGTHILVAMAASLLVLWLHRENLRRLRSGTARPTPTRRLPFLRAAAPLGINPAAPRAKAQPQRNDGAPPQIRPIRFTPCRAGAIRTLCASQGGRLRRHSPPEPAPYPACRPRGARTARVAGFEGGFPYESVFSDA